MVPVTPRGGRLASAARAVERPAESKVGRLAVCDPGSPRDDGADAHERGLMSPLKWHDRDVTMLDDEYTYVCVVRV